MLFDKILDWWQKGVDKLKYFITLFETMNLTQKMFVSRTLFFIELSATTANQLFCDMLVHSKSFLHHIGFLSFLRDDITGGGSVYYGMITYTFDLFM